MDEHLPNMDGSLSFCPPYCINLAWWHMLTVLALGTGGGRIGSSRSSSATSRVGGKPGFHETKQNKKGTTIKPTHSSPIQMVATGSL